MDGKITANKTGTVISFNSNVNIVTFNQSGQMLYVDLLNAANYGLRFGMNPEGIWLQMINAGQPGDYIWSGH